MSEKAVEKICTNPIAAGAKGVAGCNKKTHPSPPGLLHNRFFTMSYALPHRLLASALLCASFALCLIGTSAPAHAARKKTAQNTSTGAVAAPAKKKGSIKVTHRPSPSQESTAERDRRMYRECWGRPNAGACLGYTRR